MFKGFRKGGFEVWPTDKKNMFDVCTTILTDFGEVARGTTVKTIEGFCEALGYCNLLNSKLTKENAKED